MPVHIQETADSGIGPQQHFNDAVCMCVVIHKGNHIRILFLYFSQHCFKLIQIVDLRRTDRFIDVIANYQTCGFINSLRIFFHIIVRRITAHNGIQVSIISRVHQSQYGMHIKRFFTCHLCQFIQCITHIGILQSGYFRIVTGKNDISQISGGDHQIQCRAVRCCSHLKGHTCVFTDFFRNSAFPYSIRPPCFIIEKPQFYNVRTVRFCSFS